MVTDAEWRRMKYLFPSFSQSEREKRRLLNAGLPDSHETKEGRKRARQALFGLVNRQYPSGPRLRSEPKRDPFFELEWYRATQVNPDLILDRGFGWNPHENRQILYKAYYDRDSSTPERRRFREEWTERAGEDNFQDDWSPAEDDFEIDLEPEFE